MPRLLAVLVAGLSLLACTSSRSPLPSGDLEIAGDTNVVRYDDPKPAPSLAGQVLDPAGAPVADADLEGKVAVVNFWGSWCGPCRLEQPVLEEAWRELGPTGVAFVGVNTRNDQRAAALAFIDEFEVTYPSVYDPSMDIAHSFGVRVMPATFILDTDGMIVAQIIGAATSVDDLRALIEEAR